jgi:hypothetical protein
MKVLSLRLPDLKLKKIQSISDKTDMDLTTTLRMLLRVALDVAEKTSKIPISKIPEEIRSPEFMFLREVHRVKKGKK